MFRKIDAGEIKGADRDLLQPEGFAARQHSSSRDAWTSWSSSSAIDFFLNDTARHADIVLPGSLQEEDEGTVTQVEGRVIKINKAVDCPGEAREDWRIIQDLAARARPAAWLHVRRVRARSSRSCAIASKGGIADYSGITYEKIERQMGVFWPCYSEDPRTGEPIDHPGTPRLFEPGSYNPVAKGAGPFYFPDGKARFNVADYRAAGRRCRRRVSAVADDRPRGEPVPLGHPDAAHRPAGPPVSRAAHRAASAPGGKLGIADGDWATAETRRGAITLQALGGHDDPAGHDLHSVPLGRDRRAPTG